MQWLDDGGVQGEGFTIRSGFNFAVYAEGDLRVSLAIRRGFRSVEGRPAHHLIVLPEGAFARWDGSTEEIPRERQSRMLKNFVEAMAFAGCLAE